MRKSKIQTRRLEDTSYRAQHISDRMETEARENGFTPYWNCLNTLHLIINEADNKDNNDIYYRGRELIISDIPSMTLEYGSDYDKEGMQNKLRGLAESYKDFDGNYLVHVMTTLDLNNAWISDLDELMFEMNI